MKMYVDRQSRTVFFCAFWKLSLLSINHTVYKKITKEVCSMDERYIEAVIKILEAELPDCNVESYTTIKNNGVELNGVRIATADSPIAPILYMNGYYEGYTEEECAIAILKHYEEIKNEGISFDINSLTDFDVIKDRICYKVINKEANEALLEYTPFTQLYDSDLVCIYYIDLDKQATITIHDGMMQMWGISEEELYDIADYNTPRIYSKVDFKPLSEMMADTMLKSGELEIIKLQMGVPEDITLDEFKGWFIEMMNNQCPMEMYVLTAQDCNAGASVIMYDNLLSSVYERLGSDFVMFPSSTHEVIVMPYSDEMSVEELQDIVRTVNQQELSPEEKLSDNVYYYDGRKLTIMTEEMLCASQQQPVYYDEAR